MAKYKQTYNYDNEDSFGNNSIEFIISDSIEALTDETSAIEVDILVFKKLKKAFKGDDGGLVQDEMDLMSADHYVTNSDEQACLDLINSAITTKVYCAVLFNPQSPLAKEDVLYIGVFDEDISQEASKWDRDDYANSANISLLYEYHLIPIVEATFDEIKMSDVLEAITLDSTWITSNIGDRQAWRTMSNVNLWEKPSEGTYDLESYCCDLVSLNKLICYLFGLYYQRFFQIRLFYLQIHL
jgi:hypothetical protein